MMHPLLKQETFEWGDRVLLGVAFVLFLFSTYGLYFSQSPAGLDPSVQELGSLVTRGKVKRRHAKSLHWQTFSGESKVYLRDIVYTPKGSVAEFRWGDNHILMLEPDSMVQFDEVTLNRVEVQLIEGGIRNATNLPSHVIVKKRTDNLRLLPYSKSTHLNEIPNVDALKKQLEKLDKRFEEIVKSSSVRIP